ncbi:hypothetical protein ANOM_005441 [Aspergillus nomiae NRRL 13137]|uniref:Uncharacterized protein n=1 Tax=Aspergillus nomiae NRRL (strain ATCC 15546 / NRRL 13137 / CBS 260.88 / M93) TaxID=1509407 RepID=A0A0L1J6Z5_ASPN3|nr:uncharacterized protein ANOM_005441 [Aspergillus nomiae NRRL 13137]KNG87591.1 hypothetical protein ANOM_005441 [Aspergillus nomiae NRRL 13137]
MGEKYLEKDPRATKLSSLDAQIEHVENAGSEVPGQRRKAVKLKVQRHFRRFWFCYLLGGVIFLAIFLPLLFVYIIPAIAQKILNDADLPIYAARILDPMPDTVSFSIDTSLKIPAGLSVRIDPFSLSLFNREAKPMVPVIDLSVDSYKLKGTTNISITTNNTEVLDRAQFIQTLTKAVYSKRFTLSAKGSTTGHLGALKAGVTLDKDVELDGLDKLSGFSIDAARLILPAEEDGTNLRGTATLPNHSVVTFALGNVTLNLKTAGIVVGQGYLENVVLSPGNNTMPLRATLDIRKVLANLIDILGAQVSALMDGKLEISASGNSTVYDGKHIPYFEEVLNNLTITTRIPIMTILSDTLAGWRESGFLDGLNGTLGNLGGLLGKAENLSDILGD